MEINTFISMKYYREIELNQKQSLRKIGQNIQDENFGVKIYKKL